MFFFFSQERLLPLEMPEAVCDCGSSSVIAGQSIVVVTMNGKKKCMGLVGPPYNWLQNFTYSYRTSFPLTSSWNSPILQHNNLFFQDDMILDCLKFNATHAKQLGLLEWMN